MKDINTIISKSIKGQEDAQRELYMQFRQKWYMLALRYAKVKSEADDIMQEGLIQIFKDLHQYKANKSAFSTWSSRVMVNAALRYLKKNSWQNTFNQLEEAFEKPTETEDVYDQLSAKELTSIVQSLPTGYRIVFNMYAIEGYSHKEIAEQLGISEGTSKSQLSKAKQSLRKQIDYHLIEYNNK